MSFCCDSVRCSTDRNRRRMEGKREGESESLRSSEHQTKMMYTMLARRLRDWRAPVRERQMTLNRVLTTFSV